ncbi:hypothetical protein MKW94_005041, partial [Papaver nudicaule]|nr:hypothetical protein [Papaver nudicaule]
MNGFFTFVIVLGFSLLVSAEPTSTKRDNLKCTLSLSTTSHYEPDYFHHLRSLSSMPEKSAGYKHHWPEMKFGWKIIVGSIIGFIGAACGSVGGVGGGGIYVPMLTLIIGFDAKSSVPLSKCMITGAAVSTVYYNLKRRHPTLDMPVIDYNLTLLMQPMLMLGISFGVILSEIFADWMVTILLIILFIGITTSTNSYSHSLTTCLESDVELDKEDNHLPCDEPDNSTQKEIRTTVPILENVYWKELGLLVFVWVAFLIVQILKNKTTTCSTTYWLLSALQIPVSV